MTGNHKDISTNFAKKVAIIFTVMATIFFIATIIYWIAVYSLTIDFTSYYLTLQFVWQAKDPYHGLSANFISLNPILSRNLNTPITLLLGQLLQWLPYPLAYLTFVAVSLLFAVMAANLSTRYFLHHSFTITEKRYAILIYFVSFPALLNLVTGQFGSILFFLIMLGYHGYHQHRSRLTVFAWALAISMKLFAGLLLIFCLQQRRYRLTIAIVMVSFALSSLPMLIFGTSLYIKYVNLLLSINWYDGSWNASLIGFLSRTAGCLFPQNSTGLYIKFIWLVVTPLSLVCYGMSQSLKNQSTLSFAVCLVLMIVLSPLGWIYYFSVLMPALLLCYQHAMGKPLKEVTWIGGMILLTFPIGFLRESTMLGCSYRLSLYSLQFYGLLILTMQLIWFSRKGEKDIGPIHHVLFWPLYLILMCGMVFLFLITYARVS